MNISVLIADDESPAQSRLIELLDRQTEFWVTGVCGDGNEAVRQIRELRPDLLFLDVQMPFMDGLGVLRSLGPESMPITVFVTAYDQYAIRAFEANAIDYLLKPFSDERFENTLSRVKKYLSSTNLRELSTRLSNLLAHEPLAVQPSEYLTRIVIKSNGRVTFVETKDIDWIEGAGVYVILHFGSKTAEVRGTVGQLEQRLDPKQFLRIHKSVIVNASRIQELHARTHGDYTVVLKGGATVLLSRGHRVQLEEWLKQSL